MQPIAEQANLEYLSSRATARTPPPSILDATAQISRRRPSPSQECPRELSRQRVQSTPDSINYPSSAKASLVTPALDGTFGQYVPRWNLLKSASIAQEERSFECALRLCTSSSIHESECPLSLDVKQSKVFLDSFGYEHEVGDASSKRNCLPEDDPFVHAFVSNASRATPDLAQHGIIFNERARVCSPCPVQAVVQQPPHVSLSKPGTSSNALRRIHRSLTPITPNTGPSRKKKNISTRHQLIKAVTCAPIDPPDLTVNVDFERNKEQNNRLLLSWIEEAVDNIKDYVSKELSARQGQISEELKKKGMRALTEDEKEKLQHRITERKSRYVRKDWMKPVYMAAINWLFEGDVQISKNAPAG